jgi:hypothetical protein
MHFLSSKSGVAGSQDYGEVVTELQEEWMIT